MLNFSRKGTFASAGVSQMTIPSRYRSVWVGAEVTDTVVCDALPDSGGETAAALSGGAAGDCPEAGVVKNSSDGSATATEALMQTPGIDTQHSSGAIRTGRTSGIAIATEAPRRTIPSTVPARIQAQFQRGAPFPQQSTTDWARPASLVSLYLLFMSFAV